MKFGNIKTLNAFTRIISNYKIIQKQQFNQIVRSVFENLT